MARGLLRIPGPEDEKNNPENTICEAAAAFGLQLVGGIDVEEDFYLWPECFPVFELWFRVQTQWRYAPNGRRYGLDYTGVTVCMDAMQVAQQDRPDVFEGLQVMERSALVEWAN